MNNSPENTHWYSGLVWLTDAKDGWTGEIRRWGFPAVISPLHDKDPVPRENTYDSARMLPHYHIMIRFPTMEYEETKRIMATMNASVIRCPERAGSELRDMCGIRDFVDICLREKRKEEHVPANAQYPTDEVICMNGADYRKLAFIPTAEHKTFTDLCPDCMSEANMALIDMINAYQFLFPKDLEWFLYDNEITSDSRWCKVYEDSKDIFDRYINLRRADYITGSVIFEKRMEATPKMFSAKQDTLLIHI